MVAGVLVAALCAGGGVADPAQAVDPVQAAAQINHIFLSYHGAPSYTWTVRLYSNAGSEVRAGSKTCLAGCRESFPYDPASIGAAYISVSTAKRVYWWRFYTILRAGHDHCLLAKALGDVVYTGDETQGCTGA